MNLSILSTYRKVSGIAILVVVVGAFLPWVSIFSTSRAGIDGDGKLTLGAAVLGLFALVVSAGRGGVATPSSPLADVILLILAAGTTVLAGYHVNQLRDFAAIGLYLTLAAGVTWTISAFLHLIKAKDDNAAQ